MRVIYFDLGMGAAGDMLAAALYDSLSDEQKKNFEKIIDTLGIEDVKVAISRSIKCGIEGTHIDVSVKGEIEGVHEHHHEEHEHHHHSLKEIDAIIDRINVSGSIKYEVKKVYRELALAESKVHGIDVQEIHLHEVGAIDAIVDITLVCVLMEMINADRVYASPVHVGAGKVKCAHGILPVPAPATACLLEDVPIYGGKIRGELCTPTGAVLLKHFVDEFGEMPIIKVNSTGYGMGNKDFEAANCVRVFMGETSDCHDSIFELNFNVDDMTAEETGFLLEVLMNNGARDAFVIPVTMKKSRPGHLITVITDSEHKEELVKIIFKYSSTIGIREKECNRYVLNRRIETVETKYGPVRKKIVTGYDVSREKYEYEDLAKIAMETGLSISAIKESL